VAPFLGYTDRLNDADNDVLHDERTRSRAWKWQDAAIVLWTEAIARHGRGA